MLRFYRNYARVYVNNIVIFSKILKEHVKHLHTMFKLLNSKDITLLLKKLYLDYLIVILLD